MAVAVVGGLVLPKKRGKTPASLPMHSFGEEMGKGSPALKSLEG